MENYSEIKALQSFENLIRIEHYGLGRFVRGSPTSEDVDAGVRGYETVVRVIETEIAIWSSWMRELWL